MCFKWVLLKPHLASVKRSLSSSRQGSEVHCCGTHQVPHTCARRALEDRGFGSPPRILPATSHSDSNWTAHSHDTCYIHKVGVYMLLSGLINVFIFDCGLYFPAFFQISGQKKKFGWRCFHPNTDWLKCDSCILIFKQFNLDLFFTRL